MQRTYSNFIVGVRSELSGVGTAVDDMQFAALCKYVVDVAARYLKQEWFVAMYPYLDGDDAEFDFDTGFASLWLKQGVKVKHEDIQQKHLDMGLMMTVTSLRCRYVFLALNEVTWGSRHAIHSNIKDLIESDPNFLSTLAGQESEFAAPGARRKFWIFL